MCLRGDVTESHQQSQTLARAADISESGSRNNLAGVAVNKHQMEVHSAPLL